MTPDSTKPQISRRDWLKTAALGGATTVIAAPHAAADSPASASKKKVRGVIFMVSDGMSPGVLTLAQSYSELTRNRGTEWWRLYNRSSATRGLMDTASANSMVTDSAAASSAWGGGQRVNNGAINVSPSGKTITPIAKLLKQKSNARIGLVTTAKVTHATPAGFAASVPHRDSEHDIAPQYLNRVDVILGGGSVFFDPKTRPDKHDLRKDFTDADYHYVDNRKDLLAARGRKLLGTFSRNHMPFSIDCDHNKKLAARMPTLSEMAEAALSRFLTGDRPFLLQIEGARIDHAAHLNDIGALLGDQLAFDDSIATVRSMIADHDDILLVVTSDHGNANPGLNGVGKAYADSTRSFKRIRRFEASYERIFSEWKSIKNGDPKRLAFLIKSHLNFTLKERESQALFKILKSENVVEWNHLLKKPEGLLGQFSGNHTGIGWTSTTHTTDPTLISAVGPQAGRFSGIVKNSDVFQHLVEILA